ncbi:MAG: pyridoxal-dependent decarboxylase, exosortase A system-associated [Sphingomonadales bacterium]
MTGPAPPAHAELIGFDVINHRLHIGKTAVSKLARVIGGTPFYAYDRELIAQRVAYLRTCLPNDVQLHYALKANPMPDVVRHLRRLVDGFDVASAREMQVAIEAGMPPAGISFAGPGKRPQELEQAIEAGIIINVESRTELERIAKIADQLGQRPRIAVRVNPDFELKASGMKMGGGPKPFGVDAEKVPRLLSRIAALDLCFQGFHIFTGSQNLQAAALIEAQAKTIDLAVELSRHAPAPVRTVNIGGGFGIPYFPGDRHLDLKSVGDSLDGQMDRVRRDLPGTQIIIELGRFIVGEAGIYVCRIVDRKESRGRRYLITDGGLHHHLALSGNFGQVLRKNYPVALVDKADLAVEEAVDIVGCLCTPLDRLGDKVPLPRAEIGDLIVVFQSGAYGLTASPTAFLSHPPPMEVLV